MDETEPFLMTDGEIAVINLKSARSRSWARLVQNPYHPGFAELVVEQEQLTAQFVSDLSALNRLESLSTYLVHIDSSSPRTALIQAKIASILHRFSDARYCLLQAELRGAEPAEVMRLRMNIDQACATNLDAVLDARRREAAQSEGLESLVALGALLADLREFMEADVIYRRALRGYRDVSPFAVAWVCFQLGVLWGELVTEPDFAIAEKWYRRAVTCLPSYVKARVHLAEICLDRGELRDAEAILIPAIARGDPEAHWRLSVVYAADGRCAEADVQLNAARSGFEALLGRHLLAFADHGAEFYAGSGGDPVRALDLARINMKNRPTLRAFEQAHAIAVSANDNDAAADIIAAGARRWRATPAFRYSSLADRSYNTRTGAIA